MAKPTNGVDWASTGIVTEPPLAKKNSGWLYGEPPFFDYMNWIQFTLGLWSLWLKNLVFPDRGTTNGPPAGGTGTSEYSLTWETGGGLFVFQDDGTKHRISQYTVTPGAYTEFQTGALVLDQGSIDVAGNLVVEGATHRMNLVEIATGVGGTLNSSNMTLTALAGGLSEFTVDLGIFNNSVVVGGSQMQLNNLLLLYSNDGTTSALSVADPVTGDPTVVTASAFEPGTDITGRLISTYGLGNVIKAAGTLVSTGTGTTVEMADRRYNVASVGRIGVGQYTMTLDEAIFTGGTPADPGASLTASIQATLILYQGSTGPYAPAGPVPSLIVGEVGGGGTVLSVTAVNPTTGALIDINPGWGLAITVV